MTTWPDGSPVADPPDEPPPIVGSLPETSAPYGSPDLAAAVLRLSHAVETLAEQMRRQPASASLAPPGAPQAQSGPPASSGPPAKPEKTPQEKRGGLIFFACKDNGWPNKCDEIGERVLNRAMGHDARKWDEADQRAVLEEMKRWGWIQDRR